MSGGKRWSKAHSTDKHIVISPSEFGPTTGRHHESFSIGREFRVPHVIATERARVVEMPPTAEVMNMESRFYSAPQKSTSSQARGSLDEILVDKEEEKIRDVDLDMGTESLARIVHQMKSLCKINKSDRVATGVYLRGFPDYCQYLRGEKSNDAEVVSLEQILGAS